MSASAAPAAACTVEYAAPNDWGSGFTASVAITNEGDSTFDPWTLEWDFPDSGQSVSHGWSGNFSQSGSHVTVTAKSWNSSLAPGQTVTVGFNGSYSGSNPAPTEFWLNGTACGGGQPPTENEPPTVELTSPAAGSSYTPPATIELAASAADADGTVSEVRFYNDGALLGSDDTAPYEFTWSNVPAGDYSLTATATDDGGASTESDPVGVSVEGDAGPSIEADPATLTVPEGGTAGFDVTLSEQPSGAADVSVTRSDGDSDLSVQSGGAFTFSESNWDTAHTVTLAAATDDDEVSGSATFTVSADGYGSVTVTARESDGAQPTSEQRFMSLYEDIKDPASGYFSPEDIPYHSVETLIVEAPDYGHETTSETFSYWFWLEAMYGRFTGDWEPFNHAFEVMEEYMIPSQEEQPTNASYDPSDPADYVGEYEDITKYPAPIDAGVPVGEDPLAEELSSTYGTGNIYGMHWLLDTDNWYEYNQPCHGGGDGPTFINTFQRGAEESVWETVTHPSCATLEYGSDDGSGFLSLFVDDEASAQWRYTNAPDADARVVQVAYWALQWAEEQGNAGAIDESIAKAAKMGDYLRYAMYDKYFKQMGCESLDCPAGTGKNSSHYLMSWYYAWGGSLGEYPWAWRIGSSHNHFGYQNPMAAWALSEVDELVPQSPTAQEDWATSLDRQLEFYQWLQSAEGAIAGGATNSWKGHYAERPDDLPTFYGMTYDWAPVYHDPPSSQWFGWQAWSLERVAEYYYKTGDARAEEILDKWVDWALSETTVGEGGEYQVPSTLNWSGQPADWNAENPSDNPNLHVTVENYTQDVGVTGSYAKVLMFYAAGSGDTEAQQTAKALLDAMWQHRDDIGVAVPETRADFQRFDDQIYIPDGWTGQMATGDEIDSDSTFLSIRSKYQQDPNWNKVQNYLDGGEAPTFTYHRFWAQVDVATALGTYAQLFGGSNGN